MGFPVENKFHSWPIYTNIRSYFTCKVKKVVYSQIFFNNKPVQHVSSQKHPDHISDTCLTIVKQ